MKKIFLLLSIAFLYGCPEDDIAEELTEIEYKCCGENPFESTNIDNLDQSAGEIIPAPFFTPNNDGINDIWEISNLSLYSEGSLEIFNSNDESIYFSTAFIQYPGWDGNNVADGIYRYKLIVENEETYLQQGFFCKISTINSRLSTAECNPNNFDPIIDYD